MSGKQSALSKSRISLSTIPKSESVPGQYVHPVADMYPLMPSSELGDLAQDILHNGLIEPIVIKTTAKRIMIIDGRNRWLACQLAGVTPKTTEWTGSLGEELVEYIRSKNLYRRQLSASQRAFIVAKTEQFLESERSKRKRGGDRRSNGAKNQGGNVATLKKTRDAVAEKAKVGARTAQDAIAVAESGDERLAQEVLEGKKSVNKAAAEVRKKKAPPKKVVRTVEDATVDAVVGGGKSSSPGIAAVLAEFVDFVVRCRKEANLNPELCQLAEQLEKDLRRLVGQKLWFSRVSSPPRAPARAVPSP